MRFLLDRVLIGEGGWLHEINMAHPECIGEFMERYDGRIAPPILQAADVLLTEARYVGELLLREPSLVPNPSDVLSNQCPHVHAVRSAGYTI